MEIVWKNIKFKYIFACILITFIISCLISIAPMSIGKFIILIMNYEIFKQYFNILKFYDFR